MTPIYKFDQYETYQARLSALYHKGGKNIPSADSFYHNYHNKTKDVIVPIPNYLLSNINLSTLHLKAVTNKILKPSLDTVLWIHSNCSIPRAKVFQKYTRTIKSDKADFCVIPKLPRGLEVRNIAIFINRNKYKVYYIDGERIYNNNTRQWEFKWPEKANVAKGTKVIDINPNLKGSTIEEVSYYGNVSSIHTQENWVDFLESSLLYYGPTVQLISKQVYIADIMYNKIHDLVLEEDVLSTLGDDNNNFNIELCNSIKEMLNSTDMSVINLGLKTLAELDYEKFRNTAMHILCSVSSKWQNSKIKNTTSVSYMLKYLGLWGRVYEHYSTTINEEDFALLKQLILDDFHSVLGRTNSAFKSRFPFINMDFNFNVEISPKLDTETDTI